MRPTRTPAPPTLARGSSAKAAVLGIAVVMVAGCGGNSAGSSATASVPKGLGTVSTASDGVQEVTLQTQDDYKFTPDHFTVAPGRVRLTVDNVAKATTHNFRFTPDAGPAKITSEIPLLAPGQKATVDFEVATAGAYRFECSFHTQLGQVGTMTVRG